MRRSGVVAIDDFKTDLVIEFDCAIKVVADVNVDMEGNEVDAGVIAYILRIPRRWQ